MASRWFGWIRCWIPLAAVAAFAAALPCSLPAGDVTGGICGPQPHPCASSTWQPCKPRAVCMFMQCECNAGGNGQCTNATSCADTMMGGSPNVACRCTPIPLDQCLGGGFGG